MPLPEREQRILDSIEREVTARDPKFAAHLTYRPRGPSWARRTRRPPGPHHHVTVGAVELAIGTGLVVLGAMTGLFPLVAVGAVVLVIGCVVIV